MRPESSRLHRFLAAEDGPTAVEYAVLLALILVGLIFVIAGVGGTAQNWWQDNVDRIVAATHA
jgi:pilus assembly protein Flp/PilA